MWNCGFSKQKMEWGVVSPVARWRNQRNEAKTISGRFCFTTSVVVVGMAGTGPFDIARSSGRACPRFKMVGFIVLD